MHATPDDIFANRLPVATQTATHAFWPPFERNTPALAAWFLQTGAGGVVGSGHGTEAVYFDLAFQDIAAGLQTFAKTKPWAQDAALHFLEGGFSQTSLPLASLQQKSH